MAGERMIVLGGTDERDLAVFGGLACANAELLLEVLEHLLSADERARDVRAHLDHVPTDRREVKHVVEGRNGFAERGRRAECVGAFPQRLPREITVLVLREPQRRQRGRAPVRIPGLDLLHLVVKPRKVLRTFRGRGL